MVQFFSENVVENLDWFSLLRYSSFLNQLKFKKATKQIITIIIIIECLIEMNILLKIYLCPVL